MKEDRIFIENKFNPAPYKKAGRPTSFNTQPTIMESMLLKCVGATITVPCFANARIFSTLPVMGIFSCMVFAFALIVLNHLPGAAFRILPKNYGRTIRANEKIFGSNLPTISLV